MTQSVTRMLQAPCETKVFFERESWSKTSFKGLQKKTINDKHCRKDIGSCIDTVCF